MTTCQAKTANGAPCRAPAGPSGWCAFHDPEQADERKAGRRKGGLRRAGALARKVLVDAEVVAAKTPGEVAEYLCRTMGAVESGKLDHRIGATLNGLAGTLLKALDITEAVAQLENYTRGMSLEEMRAALEKSSNPCPDDQRGRTA